MNRYSILLLCTIMIGIGYSAADVQATKDYQAACVLHDMARCMKDHLDGAEEIYDNYLDNLDCDSNLIITRKDIEEYYWSY